MKLTNKLILGFTIVLVVFSATLFFVVESKVSNIANEMILKNIESVAELSYEMFELKYDGGKWNISGDKLLKGHTPIEKDNEIVNEITKKTGCLVSVFKKDVRVANSNAIIHGKNLIGTKGDPNIVKIVLGQGKEYIGSTRVDDKESVSKYIPLVNMDTGETVGMIAVGIDKVDINAQIFQMKLFIGLIIIFMLVCGIVFSSIMGHKLIGNINKIADLARVIAKGDLTGKDVEINSKDEMQTLGNAFNDMKNSLLTIVKRINEIGFNVQVSSKDIDENVQNNYKISNEISVAMQELAKDSESLAAEMGNIANKIEDTYNDLDTLTQKTDMLENETVEHIAKLKENIMEISKSSKNVHGVSERFAAAGEEITVSTEEQVSNFEGMVNTSKKMSSNAVEMCSMVSKFKITK